jgi:hypothetical protein
MLFFPPSLVSLGPFVWILQKSTSSNHKCGYVLITYEFCSILFLFLQVVNRERPLPPTDPRSNLLNAIKGGQSLLKKAGIADKLSEKPAEESNVVYSIVVA